MRVECAPCRRAGHLCPAAIQAPRLEGGGEEPMCLDCAEGRACVAERCAGRGREESSVSARLGVFGDLEFPGEETAVVHRTPEELGIAKTVPDIPELKSVSLFWGDTIATGSMRAAGAKRDRRLTMQTIAPPARAVPAPVEAKREESETVKEGIKCAFEGCDLLAYEGRKYCTAKHAYKNEKPARLIRKPPKKHQQNESRQVEIDAQRPGSATSLIEALAKVDAASERVKIEIQLSKEEINQVVDRLNPTQRLAFLSEGLRAALLA